MPGPASSKPLDQFEHPTAAFFDDGRLDNPPARGTDACARSYDAPRSTFGRLPRPSETDGWLTVARFVRSPTHEDCAMDFRPLAEAERRQLITALRGHSDRGVALLIDPKDTSFVGTTEEVPDEQVVVAVKSVPCH